MLINSYHPTNLPDVLSQWENLNYVLINFDIQIAKIISKVG